MVTAATQSQQTSAAVAAAATTAAGGSSAASSAAAMGQSQFLTLLVAQLKNQDPMNPVENNEFTSQMAQFSSLEQLMGINSNLGMMTSAVNSANTSQAINLIGKEVTAVGHNIHVKNGVGSDVAFDLPDSATDVKIVIEDASGNVVKTISRAAMPAGANQVAWDPTTDSGAKLPDGIYTYSVIANDAGGNLMDVSTYSRGVASGVSFEEGVAWVHVGEQRYMLSEIMEVRAVKAA